MTQRFLIAAAAAALGLAAGAAAAGTGVALVGDRWLAVFDTADATVTRKVEVKGVDGLLGIDYRPATGELVGVTVEGWIVAIDPETGAATPRAKMDRMLPLGAMPVVVDFNPAADKLRFMTGTVNHRVDPDTGKVTVDGMLAFREGDMHRGETPAVVAAAYTNSYGRPEKAALYNIDATIVALLQQVKPNDGELAAIGKLGIPAAQSWAFDIETLPSGENIAWLVADWTLARVSLETGQVIQSWPISGLPGPVRDVTFLPAM